MMAPLTAQHDAADDEPPVKRVRTRPADSNKGAASGDEEEEEEGTSKEPTSIERHVRTAMPLLAAKQVDANDVDASLRDKQRPPLSYARLAALAIVHLNGRAKVTEIYQWIEQNHPYYRTGTTWWKNCIRHNLSIKKFFERKGPYWHHVAELDDMSDMKEKKTAAKKKEKKKERKTSKKNGVKPRLGGGQPVYLNQWGMPQYPMSFGGAPGAMPQAMQGLAGMPGMPGARPVMAGQPGQQQAVTYLMQQPGQPMGQPMGQPGQGISINAQGQLIGMPAGMPAGNPMATQMQQAQMQQQAQVQQQYLMQMQQQQQQAAHHAQQQAQAQAQAQQVQQVQYMQAMHIQQQHALQQQQQQQQASALQQYQQQHQVMQQQHQVMQQHQQQQQHQPQHQQLLQQQQVVVPVAINPAPMAMQPALSQPHVSHAGSTHMEHSDAKVLPQGQAQIPPVTKADAASTALAVNEAGKHALLMQQTLLGHQQSVVSRGPLQMQHQQQLGVLEPTSNGGGGAGMTTPAIQPGGVPPQYASTMQAGMMMAPGGVPSKGGLALLQKAVQIASNPGSREGSPPIDGTAGDPLVADRLVAQLAGASDKLAETAVDVDVLAALQH